VSQGVRHGRRASECVSQGVRHGRRASECVSQGVRVYVMQPIADMVAQNLEIIS